MNFWINKKTQELHVVTPFDKIPFEFSSVLYKSKHFIFNTKEIRLNLFLCLMFDYTNTQNNDNSTVPDFIDEIWTDEEKYDLLL